MAGHKHKWKLSYSIKDKGVTEVVYRCEGETCDEQKRVKGEITKEKRLSNMGGEFSTNWRP